MFLDYTVTKSAFINFAHRISRHLVNLLDIDGQFVGSGARQAKITQLRKFNPSVSNKTGANDFTRHLMGGVGKLQLQ